MGTGPGPSFTIRVRVRVWGYPEGLDPFTALPATHIFLLPHPGTRPIGPVDSQLGYELLSGFPDISPYNSQHIDYYGSSRHVPSYKLGSRQHGGDDGGEEIVQARGDDIDEVEHVQGEDQARERRTSTWGVVGRLP
ncbi:hypothetical protein M9H77_12813 [Catharanthus roseus]|uniref:Uncharacterized protein n=1 Tax=Catharanthus roseus TaxID=4058 RepID=A0ACC0BIK8_CATRO|nr:hypothetical protein M9H77_12813 [Catharanthus roseus]